MTEERLEGGFVDGAVRVGDTVRRLAGPWTPAVHALLAHLANRGFTGAPRPLGFDEQGREVLTFLEGETIGHRTPRAAWVYADDTLDQVARWMRDCHHAAADFVPPPGAVWRGGGTWAPGQIIVHNDATIHNAAWHLLPDTRDGRDGVIRDERVRDMKGPVRRSRAGPGVQGVAGMLSLSR